MSDIEPIHNAALEAINKTSFSQKDFASNAEEAVQLEIEAIIEKTKTNGKLNISQAIDALELLKETLNDDPLSNIIQNRIDVL